MMCRLDASDILQEILENLLENGNLICSTTATSNRTGYPPDLVQLSHGIIFQDN